MRERTGQEIGQFTPVAAIISFVETVAIPQQNP